MRAFEWVASIAKVVSNASSSACSLVPQRGPVPEVTRSKTRSIPAGVTGRLSFSNVAARASSDSRRETEAVWRGRYRPPSAALRAPASATLRSVLASKRRRRGEVSSAARQACSVGTTLLLALRSHSSARRRRQGRKWAAFPKPAAKVCRNIMKQVCAPDSRSASAWRRIECRSSERICRQSDCAPVLRVIPGSLAGCE